MQNTEGALYVYLILSFIAEVNGEIVEEILTEKCSLCFFT